jgi:hypothetical protein
MTTVACARDFAVKAPGRPMIGSDTLMTWTVYVPGARSAISKLVWSAFSYCKSRPSFVPSWLFT